MVYNGFGINCTTTGQVSISPHSQKFHSFNTYQHTHSRTGQARIEYIKKFLTTIFERKRDGYKTSIKYFQPSAEK